MIPTEDKLLQVLKDIEKANPNCKLVYYTNKKMYEKTKNLLPDVDIWIMPENIFEFEPKEMMLVVPIPRRMKNEMFRGISRA